MKIKYCKFCIIKTASLKEYSTYNVSSMSIRFSTSWHKGSKGKDLWGPASREAPEGQSSSRPSEI